MAVTCDEDAGLLTGDVAAAVTFDRVKLSVLLVDTGKISELIIAVSLVELLLGKADVAPVGTLVMPWTSPLGADTVPDAGLTPSVPGFIVGNADRVSSLVVDAPVLAEIPVPLIKLADGGVYVDVDGNV